MEKNSIKIKVANKVHELGTNHNNNYAFKNGLDALDLWAIQQGAAMNAKRQITPSKIHIACYV